MDYCNGCMHRLRSTLFLASLFPNFSSFLPLSSIPFTASSEAQLQRTLLTLHVCQVWIFRHSRSFSFIQFPRCALSLLSLALLTWLPCDNICWKAYRRAGAAHVSQRLLDAALTAIPCPSTALLPGWGTVPSRGTWPRSSRLLQFIK